MSATHQVTGGAVVLRNPAGSSQYLYKGAVFDASTFTDKSVKHALSVGLVTKIKTAENTGVEIPEGDPSEEWSGKQIDAWAAKQTPPIKVPNGSKADKIAAIAAANQPTPPAS